MAISPFGTRPVSPASESRRARLAAIVAVVGIAATLLAYAISPGVRHAVRHAEHGVKGVVNRVFDHDEKARARARKPARHVPARSTPSRPPARAQPRNR
jgi:hypothetical protein